MIRKILFFLFWIVLIAAVILLVGLGMGGLNFFYDIVA